MRARARARMVAQMQMPARMKVLAQMQVRVQMQLKVRARQWREETPAEPAHAPKSPPP